MTLGEKIQKHRKEQRMSPRKIWRRCWGYPGRPYPNGN